MPYYQPKAGNEGYTPGHCLAGNGRTFDQAFYYLGSIVTITFTRGGTYIAEPMTVQEFVHIFNRWDPGCVWNGDLYRARFRPITEADYARLNTLQLGYRYTGSPPLLETRFTRGGVWLEVFPINRT